jgi:peptide/nickel transport system ATP-binding protein
MVFQQPARSFDPRRTLGAGAAEGLRNLGVDAATARDRVCALFERCGLETSLFDRYPHEVSGGQCQRAAIARALAPDPALVVLDEATSALDVTVQARVMGLLRELRAEREFAYLFICHDLALVQGFADRTIVLDHGRAAEEGPTADLLRHPTQPATAALVEAARALHGM